MKEQGMCSICWKVDTVHNCSLCGRTVCVNCLDASTGLCKSCKGGGRQMSGEGVEKARAIEEDPTAQWSL
ncbi:MAG: hypothetical protein JW727_05095 [Candidatus Aenigmarchaeota archaeon]|nr:hypothetical protein [Candidatus Aenigmarchaeota archaeon]